MENVITTELAALEGGNVPPTPEEVEIFCPMGLELCTVLF